MSFSLAAKAWRRRLSLIMVAVLAAVSFNWFYAFASASGSLSNAKLTMSDPRPSSGTDQSATYTFTWLAATTATLRCATYQFWTMPSGSTEPTGMVTNGTTKGTFTGSGITNANWTIPGSPTEGTIKTTNTTGDAVTAGTQVTMPFTVPRNPSTAGTFSIKITDYTDTACSTPSGDNDTLTIAATTVDGVAVSATVDSTLSFTVAGVAVSTTYKGSLSTADRCQDSATAVTFGTNALRLAADTNYDCAQSLATSTNALGGYQVTIQGKQASGDFLKQTVDSTKTITNWTGTNAAPTATATSGSSEQLAYTTNDSSLSATATRFTATDNLFAGLATTADEVAYNNGPSSNDAVNVGLRLRFTALTEAGVYAGTLVYTCTPTF